MKRRHFIAGLGAAVAWPLAVRALQAAKVKRIGLLRAAPQPELAAFLRALAEHGYVQGRNFGPVPQVGDGSPEQRPELAAA
jgi:putative ABC transport system substrate-binding protein